MSSRIPGFYQLSPEGRLDALGLEPAVRDAYEKGGLSLDDANLMVENVISTFSLPCAVGVNLLLNGEDRLVPMVVEEPSVVAAVSNMARLTRRAGGLMAESDPSEMIGQVQLIDVADPEATAARVRDHLDQLASVASRVHPRLEARGGGLRGMEVRTLRYEEPGHPAEDMVVLHFVLDCVDAMGANMVNTVAERLAPHLESITGEQVGLKILSNLADRRLSRASVRLLPEHLDSKNMEGADVAARIASAWRFAWADPYRACTHNKGTMNGVDAVALATGNDWRAIEAGVHAWAARDGQYRPVTRWELDDEGALCGSIELPLQFGTVGGTTRMHPTVQANLSVLGDPGAQELAAMAAAVGLIQNLGALRALATEGIQAGHMRMHARSVAATAGAGPDEVDAVVARLCEDRDFSAGHAREILDALRSVTP